MAEYIERNQALDRFTYEKGDMIPETLETGAENTVSIKTVKAVLRSLPAVDVAPVVHAQWIEDESGIIICPECKRGYNLIAKFTNYCPACGAKMDGKEGANADNHD